MKNTITNAYELLDIHPTAANEEIQKAYKTKAKEYHPDKNGDVTAAKVLFDLITKAKDTLLDPTKRLEHDYMVGIKKRPVQVQKIIEKQRENNTEVLVGVGLLALLIGIAIGDSSK